MTITLKVYKSTRIVVAACDSELLGKKFEEGIRQLDVRENFYKGDEMSEDEAMKVIQFQLREDATFNIVGEKSVNLAIEAGIFDENAVGKIQGIPFALKLL